MATIVTFVPRTGPVRRPVPPGSTGSVVFFTGVRYERDETGAGREPHGIAAKSEAVKPN